MTDNEKEKDLLEVLDFEVQCVAGEVKGAKECQRHATHVLTLSCTPDCTWERVPMPVCNAHFMHWVDGALTCKGHVGPLGKDVILRKVWSKL